MTNLRHSLFASMREEGFVFSGQPRRIDPVPAIPLRWPTKVGVANEYVEYWHEAADTALAKMSRSKLTLKEIASHISRRDGTCRLADKALSARSGRSPTSTKRDVQLLKRLGYLLVEYESGNKQQQRVRVLKLAIPLEGRSGQRVPGGK